MGVLEVTAAPAATGRGRTEPELRSESLRKWLDHGCASWKLWEETDLGS